MGKKARTKRGEQRAQGRKVDQSVLPPPAPALEDEVSSSRSLMTVWKLTSSSMDTLRI